MAGDIRAVGASLYITAVHQEGSGRLISQFHAPNMEAAMKQAKAQAVVDNQIVYVYVIQGWAVPDPHTATWVDQEG
jgi:hypothetical protein